MFFVWALVVRPITFDNNNERRAAEAALCTKIQNLILAGEVNTARRRKLVARAHWMGIFFLRAQIS